jgi:uncharacterized membrane protein
MELFFKILLTFHIAGGTLGLVCGTIAVVVIKGKKAHTINGKIFTIGMITAAISALIMSNLPHHYSVFLFAVGGFTLYMVLTGYRIVQLKKQLKENAFPFTAVDYTIMLFGVSFSLFLLFLSVKGLLQKNMFAIVPGVFGLICLNYIRMDLNILLQKKSVKKVWLPNHFTRMMGALIASYTAFLVVNVQIQQQWILWLLPTAVGSTLIIYFFKKFVPKKKIDNV